MNLSQINTNTIEGRLLTVAIKNTRFAGSLDHVLNTCHEIQAEFWKSSPLPAERQVEQKSFLQELTNLINRHSKENDSNTPDFILAEYLVACLQNWNTTSRTREKWYGKRLTIAGGVEIIAETGERVETIGSGTELR